MRGKFLLGFLVAFLHANAQNIGINVNGASPHPSALLDIDAGAIVGTKRGLLIPRVTTAERIAIAAPATGLVVYDTSTNSFWYYNSAAWTPLLGTATGWSTTGNAGMALGTNFLGTTDNNQLEVRVNNERAGFLTPSGTTTSWGHRALNVNFGTNNTAVGKNALTANTTANNNTAVGSQALATNTLGGQNTAVGSQALNLNLSTSNNTAVGYRALNVTVSGDNTAVGSEALLFNGLGADNTAVGSDALRVNVLGSENTAVGSNALYTNVGFENTAVGYAALYANTSGQQNTALGHNVLYSNTSANYSVGVGHGALRSNTTGWSNVAVGRHSLYSNIAGTGNVATGSSALQQNVSGNNNSAFGHSALWENTTGLFNTAIGHYSLDFHTTQSNNTAVGAWSETNTFSNSTMVGTFITVTANGFSNFSALGYQTAIDGSNRIRLGNTAITSIGGYAGWTTLPSDAKYKSNVREDVGGLDFILRLRPVTYNVAVRRIAADMGEDLRSDSTGKEVRVEPAPEILEARIEKERIRYTGFIAQEVDSAAKAVGYDFSGVDKVTDSDRMLGLRYAEFVVPLVKAVQEQNRVIEEQRVLIQQLMERLNTMESKISK